MKADRAELKNLIENKTFRFEEPNADEKVYPTLSLYKVKLNSSGLLDKLKARIVVRGDLMKESRLHGDPWSPTASTRTLKMFLADAARCKARTKQMDFIGAFLQATMKYRMFIILPAKYGELFPEYAEYCGRPLLLAKSMYGTTYSGKMWYEELNDWLIHPDGGGFRCSSVEPCLYIKTYPDGSILKFLNYVDDGLFFCTDEDKENEFIMKLKARFQLNYLGQAHWFLGMRITQEGNFDVTLDQSRYTMSIVQRYLFGSNVKLLEKEHSKPLPDGFVPSKEDRSKDVEEVEKLSKEYGFEYCSLIGALVYALGTRPDLTFAVMKLAKFMALPGKKHFDALVYVLHYLRDNSNFGLKYYSDFERSPLHKILVDNKSLGKDLFSLSQTVLGKIALIVVEVQEHSQLHTWVELLITPRICLLLQLCRVPKRNTIQLALRVCQRIIIECCSMS